MRLKLMKVGSARTSDDQNLDSDQPSSMPIGTQVTAVVHQPYGPERYGELEAALGYTFSDRSWLERALTHRSVQVNGVKSDYERLEFLGDAVFDLAVAHLLLDTYENAHEGELSKMRAALVNTASLAEVAKKLNLGSFVRLSRGELASGAHERPSILADVMEAVIGAVYREAGFAVASTCVAALLGEKVTTVTPRDPKTELQEALHARGNEPPIYRLECVEGPEHSPTFISVVEIGGAIVGRGRGSTKKASQQAAAEEALTVISPQARPEQGFSLKASDDSGNGDESSKIDDNQQTSPSESEHEQQP